MESPSSPSDARPRFPRIAKVAVAVTAFVLIAAGVILWVGIRPPGQPDTDRFLVDVQGERFVLRIADPETIRLAEENLEGRNSRFPAGRLALGDGGFNARWSWHLVPESVQMVQVAVEVCDGLPSHVEGDLEYWVEVVGTFCPWSGRIVEALP